MEITLTATLTLPQDSAKLAAIGELLGGAATAAPAAPKTRKKAEAAAAPAPAAPAEAPFDPMMDTGGAAAAAAPAAPAAPAAMTEAESTVKAQEANKALVKAFPAPQADKMPEGFHKARALLAEFGVARTTDLIHTQRIAYIAKIDALIAARPA